MPPYTRHNEVLMLNRRSGSVDANHFNQAQTALKRIGQQIRFKIPKLNHLDLILQEDAWIVVDRVLNDVPIVAWTDFQTEGRDNLHEPVPCEVRLYHFAALVILKTTLDAMSWGNSFGQDGAMLTIGKVHDYQTIVHPLESTILSRYIGPSGIFPFPLVQGFYPLTRAGEFSE